VADGAQGDAAGLRLVYDLACSFAASIDLDELVPLVVHKCREIFAAEAASVMLHDPARDELFFYAMDDTPGVVAKLREVRIPADRGIAGAVLHSGTATFGSTTLTNAGGSDVFAASLDLDGNWLWANRAGGPGADVATAVATDGSRNVYLAGNYSGVATFDTIPSPTIPSPTTF